jgi:3-deoxy-manno-octulosonate cytidylyltransferase (CMP-KDO synthetase)
MNSIYILDCTLRDGGYYTNWNFDTKMVKEMIQALDLSGVNVIELGYKSPVKGGKFRKCNDRFIWEVLGYRLPVKSKLAFMIDGKDFIKGDAIDYSLIDDVIHNQSQSPFEICRLAIKHSEIELSLKIGEYIKSKGYQLVVNLMGISLLSDNQINEFGKLSNLDPIALYFADSYGNLEPARTKQLVSLFKTFGCPIGVHTHDNLGLAFANCLSSLEEGATWIDGTILGMGRGVGNVKTEQLVTYLQYKAKSYNSKPIQKILTDWMIPLMETHKWGFTHNYMVSGLKHIHPLYPQTLQSSFLNPNRIEDIILRIEDSTSYDYSKIEDQLKPKVAVVIPARYKSSRFPGKPLAKIKGKEMIIWVSEIAEKAVGRENVYIATENEEIVDVVKEYGYKVILTSDSCLTGTDRVAEASLEIDADIIINIQGDEPLLEPSDIHKVIEAKLQYPNHIVNCMSYLNQHENVEDKKIPKVITNLNDELIYISRNPIPGTKTGNGDNPKKQVCIYAFNREHLKQFSSFGKKTPLEFEEDIEILRFIEMGYKVKMVVLDNESYAVDYPEDINIIEKYL